MAHATELTPGLVSGLRVQLRARLVHPDVHLTTTGHYVSPGTGCRSLTACGMQTEMTSTPRSTARSGARWHPYSTRHAPAAPLQRTHTTSDGTEVIDLTEGTSQAGALSLQGRVGPPHLLGPLCRQCAPPPPPPPLTLQAAVAAPVAASPPTARAARAQARLTGADRVNFAGMTGGPSHIDLIDADEDVAP